MTKLVMDYTPGFLVILRRDQCPGRTLAWSSHGHNGCCDKNHHIYKFVHAHPVSSDEVGWCLEQCRIR